MRRRAVTSVLLAAAVLLATAGAASAARASVSGDGTRDYQDVNNNTFTAAFSFDVLIKGGVVSGTFSYDNGQGLTFSGHASCGSVTSKIAVFGGQVTDSNGWTTNAVFEVSDNPDGIIVGEGATTPCDTTGFGDPTSALITTGSIKITGHG
jgi:hypothetical protein